MVVERWCLPRNVALIKEVSVEAAIKNRRGNRNHEAENIHKAWETSLLALLQMA